MGFITWGIIALWCIRIGEFLQYLTIDCLQKSIIKNKSTLGGKISPLTTLK